MATFTEPTRRLTLRWGTYSGRYLAGLLYIGAGTIVLQSSNVYAIGYLLVGTVAIVTGWFILPATGARRLIAFGPGLIASFLLLTGPRGTLFTAVILFGWLLVRERPVRSYLVLLFPILAGIVATNYFTSSQLTPYALLLAFVVLVASAWLARFLATTKPVRGPNPPLNDPVVSVGCCNE